MDPIVLIEFAHNDEPSENRSALLCIWLTDLMFTAIALWRYHNDPLVPIPKDLGEFGQQAMDFVQIVWFAMLFLKFILTAILLIWTLMRIKKGWNVSVKMYSDLSDLFILLSILFAFAATSTAMAGKENYVVRRYAIIFGMESILPKFASGVYLSNAYAQLADLFAELVDNLDMIDGLDWFLRLLLPCLP